VGEWVFGWEINYKIIKNRSFNVFTYKYREFSEIDSYLDEEFENYCQEELEKGVDKEKYLTDLSEKLIKAKSEVGILCLSRNKKNILMWSHYAKNHEGLCFGFEDKLYNGNFTYSKVSYPKRKKYELISFFNPQKGEIDKSQYL
jgi:hypothetical protein